MFPLYSLVESFYHNECWIATYFEMHQKDMMGRWMDVGQTDSDEANGQVLCID